MADPIDLFGNPVDPDQLSLFGSGENRMQAPVQSVIPDPEMIRARLNALLDRARQAQHMPWPERDARMWQTIFPQMANWLPEDEANQFRFEFMREMNRLKAAA